MVTPYFHSWHAFIHMGGHAAFVWSSWGMVLAVIVWLILDSRRQRRLVCQRIRQQAARDSMRQAQSTKKTGNSPSKPR